MNWLLIRLRGTPREPAYWVTEDEWNHLPQHDFLVVELRDYPPDAE
jgi:hypothetical protein